MTLCFLAVDEQALKQTCVCWHICTYNPVELSLTHQIYVVHYRLIHNVEVAVQNYSKGT